MTVATPGTCTPFITALWNANLINHHELKTCNDYLQRHPQATPLDLAQVLTEQGVLTEFQAQRALEGGAAELTVWTYLLLDVIGSGSLGTVYKALSRTDKQLYAIKMLPRRNVASIPRTSRELKAFREFRHPAVVPIVHVGTAGERHYLVWPYVEGGETLESLVIRQGKLAPKEVVYFAIQIARGLAICHQQKLYHGLLKPSDFLIDARRRVSILDFGIGFLLAVGRGESLLDTMTTSNQLARGLDCASPESIVNQCNRTPAGDQYSLGCVLYFALTGQYPFPGINYMKKVLAHQFEEPPPIADLAPNVPAKLIAVVHRLMRKKPEERYGSMAEAAEALRSLLTPSADARLNRPDSGQGGRLRPGNGLVNPGDDTPVNGIRRTDQPLPAADVPAPRRGLVGWLKRLVWLGVPLGLLVAGLVSWGKPWR